MGSSGLQNGGLFSCRIVSFVHNSAGMPHTPTWRDGSASNEGNDRFGHMGDVTRRGLLQAAADLAHREAGADLT